LFISVYGYSQQPSLGDKIEKEFEVTAIPDKWKNESAVIIGRKQNIFLAVLHPAENLQL
jgi:hypothetical protein